MPLREQPCAVSTQAFASHGLLSTGYCRVSVSLHPRQQTAGPKLGGLKPCFGRSVGRKTIPRQIFSCRASAELPPELSQAFTAAIRRERAPPVPQEPERLSAQEEVLHALLANTRRTIVQLERQQELVERLLEREQQQFDRLHFCLKKAASDAAYIRVLEKNKAQMESQS